MTEIVFTLKQIPNGKWRLTQAVPDGEEDGAPYTQEQDRGVYDSPALAEDAIHIILNPAYHYYDVNGDEIK